MFNTSAGEWQVMFRHWKAISHQGKENYCVSFFKKSGMHLVIISLSFGQAVWKKCGGKKKQLWREEILKPLGISSVARRKAAVGIGSFKISLWGMSPERTVPSFKVSPASQSCDRHCPGDSSTKSQKPGSQPLKFSVLK